MPNHILNMLQQHDSTVRGVRVLHHFVFSLDLLIPQGVVKRRPDATQW